LSRHLARPPTAQSTAQFILMIVFYVFLKITNKNILPALKSGNAGRINFFRHRVEKITFKKSFSKKWLLKFCTRQFWIGVRSNLWLIVVARS
jgi:hypothetical protein